MKKLLLLVSIIALSHPVFSQQTGDYNYSVGIRGYTYRQMPKIMNESNSDRYLSSNFNSFIVKFNDNQFSYRINGSVFKTTEHFFNNCEGCELIKGDMKDYAFKLGFEKNFSYSTIQPYFAFDLGYRSNRFQGQAVSVNPQQLAANPAGSAVPVNQVAATKEGFTITPMLGIKFSPIRQVSIFAESSLEFFYSYERQETITLDAANTRSLSKFNKGEYLINPVSVGIQFHFINKN